MNDVGTKVWIWAYGNNASHSDRIGDTGMSTLHDEGEEG